MRTSIVCCVALVALLLPGLGCENKTRTSSRTVGTVNPTTEHTLERQVVNLQSKDNVKLGFTSLLVWSHRADANGKPDPAAVEQLYLASIREDLPKIVADYRFNEIVNVHDANSAASKIESRMLDKLRGRAQELKGVTIDRFIIRRLDLNEGVQRQGMDELQRQRMQEIWRGRTP